MQSSLSRLWCGFCCLAWALWSCPGPLCGVCLVLQGMCDCFLLCEGFGFCYHFLTPSLWLHSLMYLHPIQRRSTKLRAGNDLWRRVCADEAVAEISFGAFAAQRDNRQIRKKKLCECSKMRLGYCWGSTSLEENSSWQNCCVWFCTTQNCLSKQMVSVLPLCLKAQGVWG